MRVNPALVKDRKNSGFSKKPGKRRLARSTQFSRNRILEDSSPRMTPSHQRSQDLISVRRRNDQSIKLTPALSTTFARSAEKGDTHFIQNPGTEKDPKSSAGEAQYRAPLHPCQEISGLVPIFNRTRDLLEYLLHIPLCMLEPRFCPRSGALLFRPVPLSNSIVSRLFCSSLARRLPACVSFSRRSAGPDPRG